MPEFFLTTSAIYSAVFGALFGLVMVPVLRRPRTWLGFGILVVINLLIPWLTATILLVRVQSRFMIHLALFLFAVLVVVNLGFLVRQALRRVLRPGAETAGEPA